MKIAFFGIPAHGHTNPTLNVVRDLTRMGHEVVYFSYESFRKEIEAAGARMIDCRPYDCEQQLTEKDRARIGQDIAFSAKVLADTTLALDEMVMSELNRMKPDCIVADSMAIWGKAAALKLGIPLVISNTTFAFNRYSSQAMKPSMRELLPMIVGMMKANREVHRLRRRGYPFKNMLDIIACDEKAHSIVFTSREFQPFAETFSDRVEFVGPSIRPVTEPMTKEKSPLVYISMGTVNNDQLTLYQNCIEALRNFDGQVILSVGDLVDLSALEPLPKHISAFQQVDQIAVVQQADVFLTHCGMNSVNEALYYGVPLVTHPVTKEQLAVASRAEELGAALRLNGESAEKIRAAVDAVLKDGAYRQGAERISEGFKKSFSKKPAEIILSACRK